MYPQVYAPKSLSLMRIESPTHWATPYNIHIWYPNGFRVPQIEDYVPTTHWYVQRCYEEIVKERTIHGSALRTYIFNLVLCTYVRTYVCSSVVHWMYPNKVPNTVPCWQHPQWTHKEQHTLVLEWVYTQRTYLYSVHCWLFLENRMDVVRFDWLSFRKFWWTILLLLSATYTIYRHVESMRR